GYTSPLLPVLLAPMIIPAAAFGRRGETWALFTELVVLLAALAFLPSSITGPGLGPRWSAFGIRACLAFPVWLCVLRLLHIPERSARAGRTAARMREAALDEHESRARGLETVGAKVAHDLKNPLSAIAGLVQLMLRAEQPPKTRERLAVVASE